MDNKKLSILILVVTILVVDTSAEQRKTHVVGDDKGWDVGVDYKAWAEGKEFDLGDKLGIFSLKLYLVPKLPEYTCQPSKTRN